MDVNNQYSTLSNVDFVTNLKKKLNNRSRSSYGTSAKKSRNNNRNGSNLHNPSSVSNCKKNKKIFSKFDYDKAKIIFLIAKANNDSISDNPSKSQSKTNVIYKKQNIQKINSPQISKRNYPLNKAVSFGAENDENNNQAKSQAKINLIKELKNKYNYLSSIFLYKHRNLELYRNILSKLISNEMKSILSLYLNKNYLSYINQQMFNSQREFESYDQNSVFQSNLYSSMSNQGTTPRDKVSSDDYVNNIKKKTFVHKSAYKAMKTVLTPFPKKKDQTKIDDIYYQKASGAANLIRRIEYSNYLKSVKNKYSKELLIKKTIMIQRWWRNMLMNNTFYYKIMVIQKMYRGHRLRKAMKEGKVTYYLLIPGIKKLLIVLYKEKFEKLYNKLLNQSAFLYQYREGKKCLSVINNHFREYLKNKAEIIDEMKKNGILFKRYKHLNKYFSNSKRYLDLIKKIIMIQRNLRQCIKYKIFDKKRIPKEIMNQKLITYKLNKLKSSIMKFELKQIFTKLSPFIEKEQNSKKMALNKIFRRFLIKSQFDKYKYQVSLLNLKIYSLIRILSSMISKIVLHPFIEKSIALNQTRKKKKLLSKFINKKEKCTFKDYFKLLNHLTFYSGKNKKNETISKNSLLLYKRILKNEIRNKKIHFTRWTNLLSKNKMSNYYSGLLILKNVLLKKISAYFFMAKNNFINKPKRLRRVTRIFTNENSKIYFVSGKSVIHSKLKKIVLNIIKLGKMNLKINFLRFYANTQKCSFRNKNQINHKKETVNSKKTILIENKCDSMQTKKIILRSILNQQISKRKIIIGKYFMFLYHKAHSQKFYERSPNKKASKLLKVSFIDEKTQKMKKNKFLHNLIENKGDRTQKILTVYYQKWCHKTKTLIMVEKAKKIQKKYKNKLGPAKKFALKLRKVLIKYFLSQFAI